MEKLIRFELLRRWRKYLSVAIQLTVTVVVCHVLLGELIPFWQQAREYEAWGIDNLVAFSATSEEDAARIRETAEQTGAVYVQQNWQAIGGVSDVREPQVQPVEEGYLRHFSGMLSQTAEAQPGTSAAYVPASLAGLYPPGSELSIEIGPSDWLHITVVGVLPSDYSLQPRFDGDLFNCFDSYPTTILTLLDEENRDFFTPFPSFILDAGSPEKAEALAEALAELPEVRQVGSGRDGLQRDQRFRLEMMGLPVILFFIVTTLCLVGAVSNALLTVLEAARDNGILYIGGWTWGRCALRHVLCNLLVLLAALAAAFLVLLVFTGSGGSIRLNWQYYGISAALVLGITLAGQAGTLVQMRRQNPAQIAERMR